MKSKKKIKKGGLITEYFQLLISICNVNNELKTLEGDETNQMHFVSRLGGTKQFMEWRMQMGGRSDETSVIWSQGCHSNDSQYSVRCRCVKTRHWVRSNPRNRKKEQNRLSHNSIAAILHCDPAALRKYTIHSQSPTLSTYYMCHLKCFHTSDWIPHEQPSLFEWNDIHVYTVTKMQREEIKNKRSWGENRVQSGWIMDLWWYLPLHPGGFTQYPGGMVSYGARVSLLSLMFNVFKRQEHPVYEGLMFGMGDKALGHTHYSSMAVSNTHRDGFLPSRGTQIKLCCCAVTQQSRSALKERQWRRGRCPFSDYRLFFFLTKDPHCSSLKQLFGL